VTRKGDFWGDLYTVAVPGFDDRRIQIRTSNLIGMPKLLVDGTPVPRSGVRPQWMLRRSDGRDVQFALRGRFFDPVPRLVVDGTEIPLDRPLKPAERAWMILPVVPLVPLGGLIGGFFGATAMLINARILRAQADPALRWIGSGLVSASAIAAYFVTVATLFQVAGVPTGAAPARDAAPVTPYEWRTFTYPDVGTIGMPASPQTRREDAEVGGMRLQRVVYRAQANRGAQEFELSYFDAGGAAALQGRTPHDVLHTFCEATLALEQRSARYSPPVNRGDYHAMGFAASGRRRGAPARSREVEQVWGRVILIQDRGWVILARARGGSLSEGEASEFLDTFRLPIDLQHVAVGQPVDAGATSASTAWR
jgi:hypothetical protein